MLPNLIVPTLNQYGLLQRMISSIDYPVNHLLVIDNGGNLKSLEIPDYVNKITILNMPSNLGVASSWNLGIKSFPFDSIWFITSDDVEFNSGGIRSWFENSSPDKMVICDEEPYFQIFSVGELFVNTVGLFDEYIHPANYEDHEYEWRSHSNGLSIDTTFIAHTHTAHATARAEEHDTHRGDSNNRNRVYFILKMAKKDLSSGQWSLARRRMNSWD